MIGKLVGGLFSKVVDNAEGILDKVITTDQVANVLEMKALQQLADDHDKIQTYSDENGFFIDKHS